MVDHQKNAFEERLQRISDKTTVNQEATQPQQRRKGKNTFALFGFVIGFIWQAVTFSVVKQLDFIQALFEGIEQTKKSAPMITGAIAILSVVSILIFARTLYKHAFNPQLFLTKSGSIVLGGVAGLIVGIGPTTFFNGIVERFSS